MNVVRLHTYSVVVFTIRAKTIYGGKPNFAG